MSIKEFYQTVGGSYNEALSRLMNDQFILRFLKKFADKNNFADLVSAFAQKDVKGIFESSHGLKGVTGNLALTNLFNLSSQICEKSRHAASFEECGFTNEMDKIQEEFQKTIALISQLQ